MAKAKGAAKKAKAKADNLTDNIGRAVDQAAGGSEVPGPSPNPATNLLIHDVLLRAGGRVMRNALEKGLLANRYGSQGAKRMVENRSAVQAIASYAVARLATRSVPGAIVVGGGLLAKTLYDRGGSRRRAQREGDDSLHEMAED